MPKHHRSAFMDRRGSEALQLAMLYLNIGLMSRSLQKCSMVRQSHWLEAEYPPRLFGRPSRTVCAHICKNTQLSTSEVNQTNKIRTLYCSITPSRWPVSGAIQGLTGFHADCIQNQRTRLSTIKPRRLTATGTIPFCARVLACIWSRR